MGLFSKKPASSVSNDTPVDNEQAFGSSVSPDTKESTQPRPVDARSPQPPVKKHSRAFSFVSILFLLTILGAGVMTYLWYNQRLDSDSLNNELSQAKAEISTLQKQVTPSGGKDFVEETKLGGLAESHHKAIITENYQKTPYVVTIKYLDKDYNFARVHVEYLATGENVPKGTRSGKFDWYVFKSVIMNNGEKEWVMLGMNPIDEDIRTRLQNLYGVPPDVLNLSKEQPA